MGDDLALVVDVDASRDWVFTAANLNAMQLSLDSSWKPDNSFSGFILNALGAVNPVRGVANWLRYGQWFTDAAGSFEVNFDNNRYQSLRTMLQSDYQHMWYRKSAEGAVALDEYVREKKRSALYSWAAIRERFNLAARVNDMVQNELNRSIENTYVIRTGCSLAVCILGSLPAAALGAFTIAGTTLFAGSWVAVAGISGAYAFTTEMLGGSSDLKRAKIVGYKFSDSVKAGAIGAGSNFVQDQADQAFKRGAQNAMRDAAARYMVIETTQRVASEGLRDGARRQVAAQVANYAKTSAKVAVGVSAVACVIGVVMMKDELCEAGGILKRRGNEALDYLAGVKTGPNR